MLDVRFLRVSDVPALLELESRQWEPLQSADAVTLQRRIEQYPSLCVGAFCDRTGKALGSLFMRPTTPTRMAQARRWSECASDSGPRSCGGRPDTLFGISLTSVAPEAVDAIVRYFWPYALAAGWRRIYLGSPMPGLAKALARDPTLCVRCYASSKRNALPIDPQLRYYHRRGFTQIVAVRADYFPHAASLDHGALICGEVPLTCLDWLWRRMPVGIIAKITRCLGTLDAAVLSARSWLVKASAPRRQA